MLNDPIEILLVEDDPNDVKLALHALREERICNKIHLARDGEEALDYLFARGVHSGRDSHAPPRLVLLDLKLPKVDGLQVLERIRSCPRTRNLPVVIMTSSSQEQDLARSYGLGANSFIQKPVDFDKFGDTVKRLSYYWLSVNEPPPLERTL